MTKNQVFFHKEAGRPLEATISPLPDWEGFDELIQFMKIAYSAKVLAEYDGPDARRWILESKGMTYELIHDDGYGNYLLATDEESEKIVRKIGDDLNERLKDID